MVRATEGRARPGGRFDTDLAGAVVAAIVAMDLEKDGAIAPSGGRSPLGDCRQSPAGRRGAARRCRAGRLTSGATLIAKGASQ